MVKKCNFLLHLLNRIKCYLPIPTRKLFFNAYILPHIDNCCTVWGNINSALTDCMKKLQKRAARIILDTPRLHYVPGGHGGHVSGHRGRNGVTVRQRRGTVSTNVSRRDCRGRRSKFLNSQKICHGNHRADDLLFRT